MKRILKFLGWFFLISAVLVVILVVAVGLYTRTESFHHWARGQVLSAVNGSIRGTVKLKGIAGSLWRGVELREIEIEYQGKEIGRIPDLRIRYSLLPLLWGRLEVVSIDARQPSLTVAQDAQGQWNIVEAFRPVQEQEPKNQSGLVILVKSLTLRQAAIDVSLAKQGPKVYRVRDLDLEGRLAVRPSGISADVGQIAAAVAAPDLPPLSLKAGLSYESAAASAKLQVDQLWVVTPKSRLRLDGQLTNLSNMADMKTAATLAIEKLARSEIEDFIPQWPIKQDITGSVKLAGPLDALGVDVSLAAADAKLGGGVTLNLTDQTPSYKGSIQLAGVNAKKLLDSKAFAGIVSGGIEVHGSGFDLTGIAASAKITVQSTQVGDWSLGDVLLQGRLSENVANLDVRLESELGGADLRGKIDLKQTPSYDLNIAVKDLDVKKVSGEEISDGGRVNLEGTVRGSGLKPAEMNVDVDIQILPSTIGAVAIQEGVVKASVADQRIKITRAMLRAKDAHLEVQGDLGMEISRRGNLGYKLQLTDLSPWLALAGRDGAGSVNLAGRVQGNLDELKTQGNLNVGDLRIAGLKLERGSVAYDLVRDNKRSLPVGTLKADLTGIEAGVALAKVDGLVKFPADSEQAIQIDVRAQDQQKRDHALSGIVSLRKSEIVARLNQLSLSLPDGQWKLTRPAELTSRNNAILIDGFELGSGNRQVSINGRFAMAGEQALKLSIERVSLESLTAFLPRQPQLTGVLAVDASIGGTAAAPEINASARLTDTTIAGQTYAGMSADGTFNDRKAEFKLDIRQDPNHTLNAQGTVPMALSWNDRFRFETLGDGEVRARSKQLSLAFLNAFAGKSVTDITGEVSLDLVARRILKQPAVTGTFQLSGGKLNAVPLGIKITDLSAEAVLESETINLKSLSARANEGRLTGNGFMALKDYKPENFKIAIKAERWPAIATQRYQARLGGNLALAGSLSAPKITGQLEVLDGTLRPDLAFLEKSNTPAQRDPTIVIVQKQGGQAPRKANGKEEPNAVENDLFKQLALDVRVKIPGNVWIRHPDAVAELAGDIRATKAAERDLDLAGRARIVRGWVGFQGRRFNFSRGEFEFTGGGQINPSLDIVAQHRLPDYEVDVVVGGSAKDPTLTLRSQPPLEQADVLALLLFGKPINGLEQQQKLSLQQNARELATGFVAERVAKSVSQALGLESLGVDIGEVDFSGGRVGLGRYVGQNTYVGVSQELAGEKGREVSIEYQVAPNWKIGATTDSQGGSGVDIIWSKKY